MMPPWRSRARWWLTAGWLWLSCAQGADVPLALGEDQDDLKAGRVADVLEQDGCAAGLVEPLLGAAVRLGLRGDRLGTGAALALVFVAAGIGWISSP